MIVKPVNKLMSLTLKKEKAEPLVVQESSEVLLLKEIRDLLKEQANR